MPATDHGAQLSYRQKGDDPFTRLLIRRVVEAPNFDSKTHNRQAAFGC